jgi:ubiquinone/menaquinone biosynthesis C-methylase UbiE
MWWRDREGVESAVIGELAELRDRRVLDVGCGRGRLTEFAAGQAAEVYALDPDDEQVAEARKRVLAAQADVTFVVGDVESIDLPRRWFDLALCGWSL